MRRSDDPAKESELPDNNNNITYTITSREANLGDPELKTLNNKNRNMNLANYLKISTGTGSLW